jgi:hypothetical protein
MNRDFEKNIEDKKLNKTYEWNFTSKTQETEDLTSAITELMET